jgi:hypothetical protein
MTCTQYLIKNAEEKRITQEHFEEFLKNNFPGYIQHGVIKFLDNSLQRTYNLLDEHNQELGKIRLTYKPDETIALITGKDAQGLVAKLIEKNSMHWTHKTENFRHEYE